LRCLTAKTEDTERGDTRRGEDGDPEIHSRLSPEAALARQDANHSPHLRVSVSPRLRVAGRSLWALCYNPRPLAKEIYSLLFPEARVGGHESNAQANKRRDIAEQHR